MKATIVLSEVASLTFAVSAGSAFFQLKTVWQDACDRLQGTRTTVFGT